METTHWESTRKDAEKIPAHHVKYIMNWLDHASSGGALPKFTYFSYINYFRIDSNAKDNQAKVKEKSQSIVEKDKHFVWTKQLCLWLLLLLAYLFRLPSIYKKNNFPLQFWRIDVSLEGSCMCVRRSYCSGSGSSRLVKKKVLGKVPKLFDLSNKWKGNEAEDGSQGPISCITESEPNSTSEKQTAP